MSRDRNRKTTKTKTSNRTKIERIIGIKRITRIRKTKITITQIVKTLKMIIVRLMEKINQSQPQRQIRRERGVKISESRIKIESQKRIIAQMQKVLLPSTN